MRSSESAGTGEIAGGTSRPTNTILLGKWCWGPYEQKHMKDHVMESCDEGVAGKRAEPAPSCLRQKSRGLESGPWSQSGRAQANSVSVPQFSYLNMGLTMTILPP